MAWLGAQLKAQLKAAENLLEAVDRTVSTATGVIGTPPQDTDSEHISQPTNDYSGASKLQGPSAVQQTAALHDSSGGSIAQTTLISTRPLSAVQAAPSSFPSPHVPQQQWQPPPQQQQQQVGWTPASSHIPVSPPSNNDSTSFLSGRSGPPPPAAVTTQPLPGSAGSYTLKQHGPFSPSPLKQPLQLNPEVQHPAHPPATATGGLAPAVVVAPLTPGAAMETSQNSADEAPAVEATSNVGGNSIVQPTSTASSSSSLPDRTINTQQLVTSSGPASNTDSLYGFQIVGLPVMPTDEQAAAATAIATATATATATTNQESTSKQLQMPWKPEQQQEQEQEEHQQQQEQSSQSLPHNSSIDGEGNNAPEPALDGDAVLESVVPEATGPVQVVPESTPTIETHQAPEQPAAVQLTPATTAASGVLPAAAAAVAAAVSAAAAAAPVAALSAVAVSYGAEDAASGQSPTKGSASSKEAQLTKLVDTLRKRLDTVRAENQQLEDLLHSAEHRTAAEVQRTQQLEAELAAMQRDQDGLVASAAANAAAQDVKIGRMQQELEAAKRQVAALQGALETIQEQHQQMLTSKDTIEGGALEAVRAELGAAESQLAAERRAHSATKAAATTRERHLEEQLSSSSEALAAMQRQVEDMAGRTREVEEQQLLAIAEAARLREQVQQLSGAQESAQQSDPSHQLQLEAKCEALQLRLDEAASQLLAAHQAQRAAEAHVVQLQQEIAHVHASSAPRGPPQLEQQVTELQELLYQKQQQLERLSADKQAQQLMLERQVTMLKQDLGRVHAEAAAAHTSSSGRVAHDIIPMDALGEPYQRLARHNKLGGAVQATARFLDTTAATASQLLRQQPLARLIVFVYVVLIHLYVYFLLARMQRHALQLMAAQEKAPGLGPH